MDIQGWLQGVTSEEQTAGIDKLSIPDFLVPKDNLAKLLVKPRRAHHTNASSILEPAQLPSSAKGIQRRVLSNATSQSSSSHDSASDKENDVNKYIKQPRRKTRPEIYESKVAAGCPKAVKGSESKRKKVKEGSNKKKKRRLEVSDSRKFVAENVRSTRLTVCARYLFLDPLLTSKLRPMNDGGVFGRAKSSAVNRLFELPDLAFVDLKYQKRNDKKEGIGKKDIADESINDISSSSNNSGGHENETNKGLTRSKHAGSGGILTKIGQGVVDPPARKSNGHRAEVARPGTKCAKGRSLTCLTWSSIVDSLPKASESIHAAAFKFKSGPFRSSSVGKLAKSGSRNPKRAQSDGWSDNIVKLAGISSSIEFPKVNLSRDGPQHVDKEPHGAGDKIFEPQIEAHPPSIRSQQSIDTQVALTRGDQMQGRSSVHDIQAGDVQVSHSTDNLASSNSIDNLLGQCYQAQQEAAAAEAITQQDVGLLLAEAKEEDTLHKTYSEYFGTRHRGYEMPEELYEDCGDQNGIGLDEGYAIMEEEEADGNGYDEEYEEILEDEEVGEEGFSGKQCYASFEEVEEEIDETLEHERIADMGYRTMPRFYQGTRRPDEAQRRFWRRNKLY